MHSGRGFAKRIIRPSSVQLFPQLTMISLSADLPGWSRNICGLEAGLGRDGGWLSQCCSAAECTPAESPFSRAMKEHAQTDVFSRSQLS